MKRLLVAALFTAVIFLSLSSPAAAQTTRTFTLSNGDTIAPASPGTDLSGVTTYYSGLVTGQVQGTTPGTFTLSVAFQPDTSVVNSTPGVYTGKIIAPYSSFSITQASGRKSVSTSGTIESGTVTYRLVEYGRAEIISVVSNNLLVWEGKNKSRRIVGYGSVDYGTVTEGAGTLTLF
jgi:hypothetical protein